MKPRRDLQEIGLDTLPRMPPWAGAAHGETLEDVAFLSGAALAHLCLVLGAKDIPQTLLRERLALQAAERCLVLSGRPERAGELRDAVHLLRSGDMAGPAGDIYICWRRAVERPLSIRSLQRALPNMAPDEIVPLLATAKGRPVNRAAGVLEAVLAQAPHAETNALILADAALSQALGWDRMIPLLGLGLTPRDLGKSGDDLRLAVHRALIRAAGTALRETTELARRVARLKAVQPGLRAKGAGEAIGLFLTRDAVMPATLISLGSTRAARRLCDRLVDLGAVRELTGRETFRLYGV